MSKHLFSGQWNDWDPFFSSPLRWQRPFRCAASLGVSFGLAWRRGRIPVVWGTQGHAAGGTNGWIPGTHRSSRCCQYALYRAGALLQKRWYSCLFVFFYVIFICDVNYCSLNTDWWNVVSVSFIIKCVSLSSLSGSDAHCLVQWRQAFCCGLCRWQAADWIQRALRKGSHCGHWCTQGEVALFVICSLNKCPKLIFKLAGLDKCSKLQLLSSQHSLFF